jgi:hypothetical protein
LYDVLTFFREGNDALAKEIATSGKQWSKTFWRKEDMILKGGKRLLPDQGSTTWRVPKRV